MGKAIEAQPQTAVAGAASALAAPDSSAVSSQSAVVTPPVSAPAASQQSPRRGVLQSAPSRSAAAPAPAGVPLAPASAASDAAVCAPAPAPAAPAPAPATAAPSAPALAPVSATPPAACEDPRIARSKQALRGALVQLTEERGLGGFSASDLCARAGLNRGTLYNNFDGIDGLLAVLEGDVMRDLEQIEAHMRTIELADVVRYRTNKKPLPFLVELFDYLREQGDFLHAMLGPGGDPSFGARLREAVCIEIIQAVLHERYRNNPEPFVQYYVSFYASAYLGVIERWLETGMQESSQEMALIAMRLFFIKPGDPIKL